VISQALDEINAGRMDGLTYEYVAEHMADEYEARRLDKV
jgi:broad specificity phosphatase PhoE